MKRPRISRTSPEDAQLGAFEPDREPWELPAESQPLSDEARAARQSLRDRIWRDRVEAGWTEDMLWG
jgi:hypothetical protein